MSEATNWTPRQEPDQPRHIVGAVVRIDKTDDVGYGEAALVVLRERDGHEWIVRTFGTVLKREWDAAKARVGDVVAIHYLGERQTKGGTTFHNWKVSAVQTAPAFVEQLADETATGERFATREEEAQIERAQRFAPRPQEDDAYEEEARIVAQEAVPLPDNDDWLAKYQQDE